MYSSCIRLFLFIVLTISWLERGSCNAFNDDSNFYSSNNLLLDELTKSCPSDGIPVCGIRHKQYVIFPNGCLLQEVNKDMLFGIQNFKKIPLNQCLKNCELQCPQIYRPICALNLKTYEKKIFFNLCEVTEYACKTNIDYLKLNLKECKNPIKWKNSRKLIDKRSKNYKRKPIPCTNLFRPVCASYLGVKSTFRNECLLNAENIKYERDWRIVSTGICAEDYTNVPQTKEKPSKPHTVKKRSYSNNFVDYTSESQIPNNDLFVYMPTEFHTQFLNPIHPIPVNKAYNDILNKIISLPAPNEVDNRSGHEDQVYDNTEIKPMPFVQNHMSFNYMPNENFIKNPFLIPEPSAINTFMHDDNKGYYYTFEKVEPNREHIQMNHKAFKSNHETEKKTLKEYDLNLQIEQTVNEKVDLKPETKQFVEALTTISTPLETPLPTTTEISAISTQTTSQPEVPKKVKPSKIDKSSTNIKECKFGIIPICGVLPDGTVQTFETMCEMMTANIYLTKTWTKLHEGDCESCKYDCKRDYQPICVTRNGINYTMINDCYFNMGICMDKKSKWKKISNGQCERYTRIPDKYEYSKRGFPYTSSYITSEAATTANSLTSLTTNKPLRLKSRKSKYRKTSSNRVVNRRSSSLNTNPRSRHDNNIATEKATTRLSLYGPHTDSYIMRIVSEKAKSKFHSIN